MTPTRPATHPDPRWSRVVNRDRTADRAFVYAVRTTGIYCRPSCGARLPLPENVLFFPAAEHARSAGFRPCRRCKPDLATETPHARKIEAACRAMETAENTPDLAALAAMAGLSPFHFHRVFRQATGLTPRAYATAHRARRVHAELARTRTVTEAIYEAGFNASSRFYAAAGGMLGMTPSTYRSGGASTEIRFAVGMCSLGAIIVATSQRGVCAILLGDNPESLLADLQHRFPRATLVGGDAAFDELVAAVIGFVETPSLGLDLPLDVRGTAFQHRVWQALRLVPPGSTISYAELASRIGAPKSARAVAAACAANALAVAIPCHRVVRSGGALSGYRWGIARKQALLARETS